MRPVDGSRTSSWTSRLGFSGRSALPMPMPTTPRGLDQGGVNIDSQVGSTVNLRAKAKDPDGDALTYKWYQYAEADSYAGAITLNGAETAEASFSVPADAPVGSTVHVILEVQDNGTPAMKEYERVVVTVTADKTRPQVSLIGPTTAGPFAALAVTVDASDGGGLQRIVANIYKGSTLRRVRSRR